MDGVRVLLVVGLVGCIVVAFVVSKHIQVEQSQVVSIKSQAKEFFLVRIKLRAESTSPGMHL